MTPERKEEYKALLAAATPGMWQAEGKEIWRRTDEHGGEFYAGAVWITDVEHDGNRNLIAAAPVVIADLLAALEEAQQAITALHEYNHRYAKERDDAKKELAEAQQTIARQGEIIHAIDRDLTKLRLALIAIAGTDIIGSSAITMKAIAQEALQERVKESSSPACPTCGKEHPMRHPNRPGIYLCLPEDGEQP